MKYINWVLIGGITAIFLFGGCKGPQEMTSDPSVNSPSADSSQISYRLIYVVHGDANYLYHNKKGEGLQADEQQMKEAKEVAQKAHNGEVFIFHQQPEKKILWLFPQKDRAFLHYQNGKLVQRKKYSPGSSDRSFVAEHQLYKKFRSPDSARSFFMYFGHEIPQQQNITYHQSRPDAKFDSDIFTKGMQSFLGKNEKFDLTLLSTCDNGTPLMAYQLQSLSRYMLASPQNLHLSHMDTQQILRLEETPDISIDSLADAIARQTYQRLADFIETEVTLSIYNLQYADSYLATLSNAYRDYRQQESATQGERENTDCAELSFWDEELAPQEMSVFYKSSNFGRHANRKSHSGWGCQK